MAYPIMVRNTISISSPRDAIGWTVRPRMHCDVAFAALPERAHDPAIKMFSKWVFGKCDETSLRAAVAVVKELKAMQGTASCEALGQMNAAPKKTHFARVKLANTLALLHDNAGDKLVQIVMPSFACQDGGVVDAVSVKVPLQPCPKMCFFEPTPDVLRWMRERVLNCAAQNLAPARHAEVTPLRKGMYWHASKGLYVAEKPVDATEDGAAKKRYKLFHVADKNEPQRDAEQLGAQASAFFWRGRGTCIPKSDEPGCPSECRVRRGRI